MVNQNSFERTNVQVGCVIYNTSTINIIWYNIHGPASLQDDSE